MKLMLRTLLTIGFAVGLAGQGHAFVKGTKLEAQELVKRAVEHFETVGEAAFDEFTQADEWKDRDLYIFVFDNDGIITAHGFKPALVGVDASGLRDVNGYAYVKDFLATETSQIVTYTWQNPVNKTLEKKESFIVRSGDFIFGSGYYH